MDMLPRDVLRYIAKNFDRDPESFHNFSICSRYVRECLGSYGDHVHPSFAAPWIYRLLFGLRKRLGQGNVYCYDNIASNNCATNIMIRCTIGKTRHTVFVHQPSFTIVDSIIRPEDIISKLKDSDAVEKVIDRFLVKISHSCARGELGTLTMKILDLLF